MREAMLGEVLRRSNYISVEPRPIPEESEKCSLKTCSIHEFLKQKDHEPAFNSEAMHFSPKGKDRHQGWNLLSAEVLAPSDRFEKTLQRLKKSKKDYLYKKRNLLPSAYGDRTKLKSINQSKNVSLIPSIQPSRRISMTHSEVTNAS